LAVWLVYYFFLGRFVMGGVLRGFLRRGATLVRVPEAGSPERFRVNKLFGTRGLERVELDEARAGDLVTLAGIDSIQIGDTVCDPSAPELLPRIPIEPPTIRVRFSVNSSPFAGREGRFVTGRQVGERLRREALGNVSIRVEGAEAAESFEVAGRGELQLGILIETMRREGFEFSVSRPEIIAREIDGKRCEPVEEVVAEVPDSAAGAVMESLAARRGRMEAMEHRGPRVVLRYTVPSRRLFGYRGEFLTQTRGEGVLHRTVKGYEPWTGEMEGRGVGAIVASEPGTTTAYALGNIQDRATMFVPAGVPVYEGQIVGENRRPGDMNVNVCRGKKLTNIRAAGKDDAILLTPPRAVSIESALEWIEEDELLEVTPQNLRLRKRVLAANFRKR
jgi:GTP-binding protein